MKHGGDRRSKKFRDSKDDDVPFEKPARGNSKSYALRRLREPRPDLHQKVPAGEMSASGAMIAAGLRKKNIAVAKDVESAARTLREHFNGEEINRLIELLSV